MKQLIYLYRKAVILLLTLAIGGVLAVSCRDDEIYVSQENGVEGAPTVLALSVNLNEMKAMSRAAMADENTRRVNTLWVGIYNVATGKCTYSHVYTRDELLHNHTAVSLEGIETKSGVSYVVAVANVADNYGITDNADLKAAAGLVDGRGGTLQTLLEKADTWEKYKSISFMLTDPSNIDFSGSNNLTMSGSYHADSNVGNDPDAWYDEEGNPESVYISATTAKLPGYIHLRRMISYVKFNIAANPNIIVEPVSWKVYNNPIIAYLQERGENAADVSTYFGDREEYSTNYGESNLSYDFTPEENFTTAAGGSIAGGIEGVTKGVSFDFYQFENKQKAIEYAPVGADDYVGIRPTADSPYADREREWKIDMTDAADNAYKENTSVYKSLSESATPGEVNLKNHATYVTFRLKVTYWINQVNDANIGTETPVNPAGNPNATRREGYANYTVHLGYIEGGSELEKAHDFNCRRNMKYTYNIKVNSLNNIIVEAFSNEERQPGAEGDVTDVQNTGRVELDAHYSTFNIQLTYSERQNLQWMIEAPYDNMTYSYYAADYRQGGVHAGTSLEDNQFYNWIRFKPTRAGVLRRYKDSATDDEPWTLEQLADPDRYLGVDANNGNVVANNLASADTPLWYTVFIDEYVYHKDEKGNSTYIDDPVRGQVEGGWRAYVNQAPRIAWIACNNRQVSADRESIYLNSKYMISQNSILTYYSATNPTPNETALGMEREGETFGLNLAWSQAAWNALNNPNADNGRYNVWYYLTNGNISSKVSASGRGWSSVAATQNVQIGGSNTTCYAPFSREPISTAQLTETSGTKTAPVFMPASINTALYNTGGTRTTYNPFPYGANYEVITACMSRNRDENGDGVINVNEMKWYVPTTGKYARIILGRAVIPQSQRLMNFDETPVYGFNGNTEKSDNNTRYHFASSDKKVVWAEEGTSTSDWLQGDWDMGAWQVRCVRNLGVNMGRVIEDDPVTPAYKYENLMFTLAYYEDGCKRAPQSNYLLAHDVQSSDNQPAYQFEVANARCNSTNTTGINSGSGLSLNANGALSGYGAARWKTACDNNYICGRYSQEAGGSDRGTWRVPNQKELVMMRREGLLVGTNDVDAYLSCTQEHFEKTNETGGKRFFLFFPNRGTVNPSLGTNGAYHVRCVRDVMNN